MNGHDTESPVYDYPSTAIAPCQPFLSTQQAAEAMPIHPSVPLADGPV
jgi:hypothetical protein